MLSAEFLLIGCLVGTLSVDISKSLFLEQTTSSETEHPTLEEILDRIKEPELTKEFEPLSVDDEYPIKESELEKEDELPSFGEEDRAKRHVRKRPHYPDYEYEDQSVKESSAFQEKWYNAGNMEISYIGRFDPHALGEGKRRRRGTGRKTSDLHKRDVMRAFSRTEGCNRLPEAPDNSMGKCHHNNDIGKCWVLCHKFSRYPNDMKQRTLLCLNGLWQPTELPDCVPQTLCEETELSGNNMYVSCTSENERGKCTGTCVDGFAFPDSETAKEVECKELDGELVAPSKFPDCSFGGNATFSSVNTTEEPMNDTWIYF